MPYSRWYFFLLFNVFDFNATEIFSWSRRDESGELSRTSVTVTVKRVDEVVRHPHLVAQDQKTQVSNKFFDIPVENFTINI